MGFKTDVELANYLGVSRSTLSNWCARNSIDFPTAVGEDERGRLQLAAGREGNSSRDTHLCQLGRYTGEVETIYIPKTPEMKDDRYVQLYDVSAAANLRTMLMNRNQYVLGKIVIPNISSCDGAVYVSGDSMYPLLKSVTLLVSRKSAIFIILSMEKCIWYRSVWMVMITWW